MKRFFVIISLMIGFSLYAGAQDFKETDIPAVKEIQTNILDLMVKGVMNYEDMRGTQVLEKDGYIMYKATPKPTMHATEYYVVYLLKNKRSYYMSYYADPHDMMLVKMAVMTMNAYAGDKWKAAADPESTADADQTNLYCDNVKVGMMRVDNKAHVITFSVGFFSEPGSGTSEVKKETVPQAPAANSNSMLDYGIFAKKTREPASNHDYKIYCFISTCSQGNKTFTVLSKVTADLAKHSMDEMKADAMHRISNNGWTLQSGLAYAGVSTEVNIKGVAGRDYVVSETEMYDFTNNGGEPIK